MHILNLVSQDKCCDYMLVHVACALRVYQALRMAMVDVIALPCSSGCVLSAGTYRQRLHCITAPELELL